MNFKLDYITRILQKTSHKRIENYVISRIWHQLNDDEIKLVHQQYVDRGENNFALTDLYFPQFNYHIEVNEEFHYANDHKINNDQKRANDIIKATKGHIVRFINCQNNIDLNAIHAQIDEIVGDIKNIAAEQRRLNTFIPWSERELHPLFWKEKGILNVSDNINLRTIDDIGLLFERQIKNKGFLKAGAVKYDKNGFSEVWWPSQVKKAIG